MPDQPIYAALNVHTADYSPMADEGGTEALVYRSADGTRVAGSFRHSGAHAATMAFDEFFYVIAGHATVTVDGGSPRRFEAGDACYLRQDTEVTFEFSDDFHDVVMLVSDTPISY